MKISAENLLCVAPSQIEIVWPIVASMIDAAYEALDEVTPDVRAWLLEERGLLWVLVDDAPLRKSVIAAATTSLIEARGGRACRVVACGGSQADWVGCMAAILRYAAAERCYKVVIDGRRGWSRMLTDFEPVCVSYEKRI